MNQRNAETRSLPHQPLSLEAELNERLLTESFTVSTITDAFDVFIWSRTSVYVQPPDQSDSSGVCPILHTRTRAITVHEQAGSFQ